jgi:hypothetical protein
VVIGSNKTKIFFGGGNRLVLVIALYVQDYSFYMKGNYYSYPIHPTKHADFQKNYA